MDIWNFEKIFIFGLKWRTLLVLDNATTHKTSKVKENSKYVIYRCQLYQVGLNENTTFRHQY